MFGKCGEIAKLLLNKAQILMNSTVYRMNVLKELGINYNVIGVIYNK